jgi:hypothetical protein
MGDIQQPYRCAASAEERFGENLDKNEEVGYV